MILSIYRFVAGWLNVEFCGEQVSREMEFGLFCISILNAKFLQEFYCL